MFVRSESIQNTGTLVWDPFSFDQMNREPCVCHCVRTFLKGFGLDCWSCCNVQICACLDTEEVALHYSGDPKQRSLDILFHSG